MYPTAIFKLALQREEDVEGSCPWSKSYLNPKNRIETLSPSVDPKWRIDGAEADGVRFFSIPYFALGKPSLRIDTYIPPPTNIPSFLRDVLQPSSAMLVGDSTVCRLAIGQHILHALDHWLSREPDLESRYLSLPFGSKIVVDLLCSDVRHIELHLIPIYHVELKWVSLSTLETLWDVPHSVWPEIVDFADLKLLYQPHEAITLVQISGKGPTTFVFKSGVHNLKFLHHELRMLLTMAANQHFIPLVAVVTKRCVFGGKIGVCGFILEYHEHGTLRDVLSRVSSSGKTLCLNDQLRWAREITSGLIHIQGTSAGFYSDLKLNNILLAQYNNQLKPMFVDFEQRGGWHSWSPPEVFYIEYLEYVASSDLDPAIRDEYTEKLKDIFLIGAPASRRSDSKIRITRTDLVLHGSVLRIKSVNRASFLC